MPRVAGVAALTAALQPAHVGAPHSSGDASRGRFAGRGRGRGRGGGGSGGGARAQAAATAAATAAALSPSDAAALKRSVLGPLPERPLSSSESKYVGLDCEMVGVGPDGARSVLAQVVLVDFLGRITYLSYVAPSEPVTDYRTAVSGIRPEHVRDAPAFDVVQREVARLLEGKVIVGHGLENDMKALLLSHSWKHVRDTAKYRPFCRPTRAGHVRPRRLKHLSAEHLGVVIQTGEHDPAEDAQAALALFKKFRRDWEASLQKHSAPVARGREAE